MNSKTRAQQRFLTLDRRGEVTGHGPHVDLGLYPTRAVSENVRLGVIAEALGFSTVWVADSPVLWREMWVNLTAITASTDRVRLGSAVTSGITRHPSVTASAALSLDEWGGGRFALGLGIGDSSLITSGAGRPQTLAEFRETLVGFRALLSGEPTRVGEKELILPWAGKGRIPIFVAATGPKMLELSGEIADGVIIMVGVAEEMVRAAIDRVRAGAKRAGRTLDSIEIVLWAACAVSDTAPEDAYDAVRANVARASIRKLPAPLAEPHVELVNHIREVYDYAYHSAPGAPHGKLVTNALVDEFAFVGTSDGCAEQLRQLAGLPLASVALAVPDSPVLDRGEMLARIASAVLPRV